MSTSTIDYDALAAQHGGSAQIDYDALAAQHGGSASNAGLDLSNKQGQGTYQMKEQSGQIVAVPYGQVQQAAQMGYGFASDADKFRFAKDNAADPNKTTSFSPAANDPRASLEYQQQMERNSSLPMQVVGGIAKGGGTLARPVLNAMDYATTGSTQDVSPMLEARTPVQKVGKYGTIAAAIVPAAVTAPLATAGGVVGGTLGAGAGQVIGKATGMSPGATDVLSDTLGLAAGAGGAVGARPLVSALDFNARKQAAGALLQSVAHDANKIPVQLDNSADAAVRLMDWQKKTNLGPTINKFLNRITNPNQGPLTYEDARDFYQLLGKMSVDETNKLAPSVRRDLTQMVVGLKQDIGSAADTVGRAADYYQGLGDYARAAKLQDWYNYAKDTVPGPLIKGVAGAAGAGGVYSVWKWLTGK